MAAVLIIHLGIHKTGTTSLQAALRHNQDSGHLKNVGVNYVRATREGANAHHAFARLTQDFSGSDEHMRDLFAICDEVLAYPEMFHLISSEAFDQCSPAAHRFLRDTIEGRGIEVRAVITLRDVGSLLGSVYQQHVKQGLISADTSAFIRSAAERRGEVVGFSYIHEDIFIQRVFDVYGSESTILIDYRDFVAISDGVSEFLVRLGIPGRHAFDSLPKNNVSLTLEKMSFLVALSSSLREATEKSEIQDILRPVLYRLAKSDVKGEAYQFPITCEALELCELVNKGLSNLARPELSSLLRSPVKTSGTPLLDATLIPEDQLRKFLVIAGNTLPESTRTKVLSSFKMG